MSRSPDFSMLHPRSLIHNLLSYAGIALAVITALLISGLVIIEVNSPQSSPYLGVLTYLVLPPILILGLLLVPIGMGLENRRRRRLGEADLHPPFPRIDLNQPRHQRLFALWAAGTLVVMALLGVVAYQSYEFMESTTFCGDVCHTVMQPEKTAYLDSPHARVACTECHIGPGADWWAKSKLSGAYQVYAVLTNVYPRPIDTPIHNLRPARETCEQCHWPEKFYGDKIVTHTRFQPDEQNTPQKTSMVVKTGGGSERMGLSQGVHWHMDPRNEIDYIAIDEDRQEIPWVQARTVDGSVTEYVAQDKPVSAEALKQGERRQMDCIDCHNRPTHIFFDPNEAIDREMAVGRIDPSLPWAKKVGLDLITRQYASHDEARRLITTEWERFYRDNYPQIYASKAAAVQQAADRLVDAYTRNVFPQMNVTWGTYHSNIGHQDTPGCFRCHDGKHVSSDGKVIRNDCTLCHSLPVQGEPVGLQVAASKSAEPTQPAASPPSPQATGGGLHNKATHAGAPCQTCHTTGGPGSPVERTACYSCHSDKEQHNAGVPCQTCHAFK